MQKHQFRRALLISLFLHAFMVLLLSGLFGGVIFVRQPKVLKVQLVSLPQVPKKSNKTKLNSPAKTAKLQKIKTQASAAPKAPPKNLEKPVPKKVKIKAPKVKVKAKKKKIEPPKPKAIPKKVEPRIAKVEPKKEEPLKRRPPKLDKTPDKAKAVRTKDKDAKTVADADDFLATLSFVDDLKKSRPLTAKPIQGEEETVIDQDAELSLADQAITSMLTKHIRKFWFLPPGLRNAENLTAAVEIKIKSDGMISDIKVTKSSGFVFFDSALMRAVRKAEPLPIPLEKHNIFKVIELHFSGKSVI